MNSRLFRIASEAAVSLRARKSRALLMTLGVMIGIAALTVIVSIGEGTRREVLDVMNSIGFGADAIYIRAGGGKLWSRRGPRADTLSVQDAHDIGQLYYVKAVGPQQSSRAPSVFYLDRKVETRVNGVGPEWSVIRSWQVVSGRFITDEDDRLIRKVCVLGQTLRKELFGVKDPLGKSVRIKRNYYRIVGVLEGKGFTRQGYDLDDRLIVPLSTSKKLVIHNDSLSAIRVQLESGRDLESALRDIPLLLRENHGLAPGVPDDFTLITPAEILEFVTRQYRTLVWMLVWIAAISLFISGIVIMNIMLVSVNERRNEIGVRRSMGARQRDILVQFLLEAVIVALLGGLAGVLVGIGINHFVTWVLKVSTALSWKPFLLAGAFSMTVGLFFGVFPARRASRLTPAQALR
jgi:putative ABC transport system permease protein